MSEPEDGDSERPGSPGLVDALMDAFIYAPLGLTLDAQEIAPDLARRGRQHAAAARQIGEFAVKAGRKRLDDALAKVDEPAEAPTGVGEVLEEPDVVNVHVATDPSDLAIPGYATLAASQVVKRLDALSPVELEAVRQYEAAGRDRRTILHKITRLQG
jgi:hypothetical protein